MKQLFREVGIYGFLLVLSRLAPLITAPILTTALSVSDFGVFDSLNIAFTFLAIGLSLGTDKGLIRDYHFGKSRPQLVTAAHLSSQGITAIVLLLCLFAGGLGSKILFGSTAYRGLIWLAAVRLPFAIWFQQASLVYRLERQPWRFTLFQLLFVIGNVSVALVYRWLGTHLTHLILGQSLMQALVVLPMVIDQRRFLTLRLSKETFKGLLRYSLPLVPAALVECLLVTAFPPLLAHFGTLDAMGIYAVASKTALGAALVSYAFLRAVEPYISELMKSEDQDRFSLQVRRLVFLYWLTSIPLVLGCWVIRHLFEAVIDPKFAQAAAILPAVALGHFFLNLVPILGAPIAWWRRPSGIVGAYVAGFVFITLLAPDLIARLGYLGGAIVFPFTAAFICYLTLRNARFFADIGFPFLWLAMFLTMAVVGVTAEGTGAPIAPMSGWLVACGLGAVATYAGTQFWRVQRLIGDPDQSSLTNSHDRGDERQLA